MAKAFACAKSEPEVTVTVAGADDSPIPTTRPADGIVMDPCPEIYHAKPPKRAFLQRVLRKPSLASRSSPTPRADPLTEHHLPSSDSKEDTLSFYQKFFTTSTVDLRSGLDTEKTLVTHRRSFSVLSFGFIFCTATLLFLLAGIIAAAVASTFVRRDHDRLPPSITVFNTSTSLNQSSPIRAALDDNFADPSIWYANGTWYAYATNNAAGILSQPRNASVYEYGAANVQLATSPDFINWTLLDARSDPLPIKGSWVPQGLTASTPHVPRGNVWAPSVIQRPTDTKYVLYYSAITTQDIPRNWSHPPPHCIGAAVSEGYDPAGPYVPIDEPLACPVTKGGAIDPAGFRDKNGTMYVAYKVDGNNIGHGGLCGNTKSPIVPTPIMLQQLHADGVTKVGKPVRILDRTTGDGPLIEAPALVRSHQGIYFLFFSSGCTRSPTYDVKYATASHVTGPYTRATTPLLQSGDWGLLAPGSVGIHEDGKGGWNMAFHARVTAPQGGIRAMFTTKLKFNGTSVELVAGP